MTFKLAATKVCAEWDNVTQEMYFLTISKMYNPLETIYIHTKLEQTQFCLS